MGDDCISNWARKYVGDIHLGKRKFQKGPTNDDPKRQKEKGKPEAKSVSSDTSTDDGDGERSPPYQETEDSSSADDGGGGGPIRFTGTHCTYICTPVSD